MNTIIKRIDTTYGGYDYIEYNTAAKRFHTGNSRAHTGHYIGDSIEVQAKSVKELTVVRLQLQRLGFTETNREN